MSGPDPLQQVLAEAEIGRVLTRYAQGVDQIAMDVVASCYHADAVEDRGRFRGSLDAFLEWLEAALRRLDSTWHLIGTPAVVLDGEAADVETYCLAWHRSRAADGEPAQEHLIPCRYLDRFERREGEWRIARRSVTYETDPDGGSAS
jgi:hypothetical protein